MSSIVITADSTFDMPLEMAREYDIKVIPSYIQLGDISSDDYPDVSADDIFSCFDKHRVLPKTSAANPDDYLAFFSKYAKDGAAVIHIAKSGEMSACCNNAIIAAAELQDVHVFDSKFISGGSALIAMEAVRLAKISSSAEEVLQGITRYRDSMEGSFVIEELKYLHAGGRCSAVALLGANTLKIRPCIHMKDGKMGMGGKFRGSFRKCIDRYIDAALTDPDTIDPEYTVVCHSLLDDKLTERAIANIRDRGIFRNIIVWPAGAAVTVHCGPNTFGLFVIRK